jgi:predicted nucleotidyltransferase
MKPNPAYEEKYTKLLKEIVLKSVLSKDCKIFLFGSRVSGNEHFASDFDIGILGLKENDFEKNKLDILNQVEESIIPWKVDIVNFEEVSESFRENSMKQISLWRLPSKKT